jgi:SEC-C motif-containing protein
MPNIGRNQPCPCGSGKKYKRCHGAYAVNEPPLHSSERQAAIDLRMKQANALNARREKQQGLGRPIIAAKLRDHQMVAVGKRVHFSTKWRTFHDFLRDHLFSLLGKEWGEAELAKPTEERHRILRWFDQATEDARRTGTKTGEVYSAPMSGAARAFVNLAYNIYLIAHHTEKDGDAIVKGYVERLKSARSDDFAGALFETYAAAAFLKAGFTLAFENERDGSVSHVEFVALYPKTGKRFSVEVKARERGLVDPGAEDVADVKRLRVANKLNKALGKTAAHTRVVMIEINVPEVVMSYEGWPAAAMAQIRHNEQSDFPGGEKKPSAYVFVTNHAFHNNLAELDVGMQVLAAGFRIPDFGPEARHPSYKGVLAARAHHVEMFALLHSMQTHYEIPSTFDGEMPQLVFQDSGELPRLQFGRTYLVPTEDGREVPGRLYDAVVQEENKQVVGCYELATGVSVLAVCPISDAELAAYRAYPDTFFGEIRQPARHAKTLVDWCDFFYETYKDTPRDKLLEWMSGAPDIEQLRTLPQEDLAIIICERWAYSAFQTGNQKHAS